ncbi:DUF4258 domain-containing protein [Stenotrophomonas sp. MMGLT7]|uniref:DUF4258 domain-containing protein n=1 Tax=Stenotrophomonas sp. MMGLT7 TaxID=2901227 RepID=UPI001E3991A0|nr:DUF4258 domain-containing protein [Stenotrophomonas sp. MMGLT7]MCD7097429.1 DUF4258 domain-containing protein [Stenotrophomonas sp. MMGLT7]
MELKISPRILTKLRDQHRVTQQEVAECFANRWGKFFTDSRHDHQTNPPTYWFVSETDQGRMLKVIFVRHPEFFAIKSAYDPEDGSDALYERLMKEVK